MSETDTGEPFEYDGAGVAVGAVVGAGVGVEALTIAVADGVASGVAVGGAAEGKGVAVGDVQPDIARAATKSDAITTYPSFIISLLLV
jgi:dihydroxyacetone kinase